MGISKVAATQGHSFRPWDSGQRLWAGVPLSPKTARPAVPSAGGDVGPTGDAVRARG